MNFDGGLGHPSSRAISLLETPCVTPRRKVALRQLERWAEIPLEDRDYIILEIVDECLQTIPTFPLSEIDAWVYQSTATDTSHASELQ